MKKCPTCKETYPGDFAMCPRDGSALVEAGAWSEGTLVRGKYRILSKLGQGGMGSVYKARHVAFDELRALKVMNPELTSDELFVRRFKHEAVITRKLQHPNAVRVDDIDETEDGRPFIVMEYIEGQSLKKLIEEQGPLPVPRVCLIIKQAAAGLEAAHRLGMVHRDIKPDNIVLIESPQGEQAKVLDFGIAKIKEARADDSAGSGLTGTGVIIGTPQYMSPEQAMGKRGDDLDGRSDLYSLGVVMYQMLAGELPFKADTAMDMLLAHLQKQPPPLRMAHPELGVPEGIASLVARLLEKKPESRPASADALIEEIEQVEKEVAVPGATRVLKPIIMAGEEAAPAAPAAARVGAVPDEIGTGREPPLQPAPAARPRPSPPVVPSPAPRPAPVAAPKASSWRLWAAIGVLVLAVGGGGLWYTTMRRPGLAPAAPATPQQTAPSSPAPAQSTSSPGTSSTNQQPSAPAGETTQPSAEHKEASGGTGNTPLVSTPSTLPTVQPSAGGTSKEQPKQTAPPRTAVDPQKIASALRMGKFYLDRGNYDKAFKEYEEGLKVDPKNADLRDALERARKAKAAEEKLNQ